VGRPREHNDQTAAALLAAAELTVQESGPDALSVRGVAKDVGTTTRAVYSLFGSKDGLMAALAAHAFELLRDGLERLPVTSAPDKDLVEAGLVFRRFAVEHPSLFRIAFQSTPRQTLATPPVRSAATTALEALKSKIARLDGTLLAGTDDATLLFHALCEGLARLELRQNFPLEIAEQQWRQGLQALVHGLTS
jgi:AcrR family transcriptional regulator